MTHTSYPKAGKFGMSIAQWQTMLGSPDAIIEDYDPSPVTGAFGLTKLTNSIRLAPGKGIVDGYVYDQSTIEDFSTPAPASGTLNYQVAIMYDPALNVPVVDVDPDVDGTATADGACRMVVSTSGLDTSGGKKYLLLWEFPRASGQSMSSVTVTERRIWTGPVISNGDVAFPGTATGIGPWPRGTTLVRVYASGRIGEWIRWPSAGGTSLVWRDRHSSDWIDLPLASASGIVAYETGSTPQYRYVGGDVVCKGAVKRSSGAALNTATGPNVTIGTLPAEAWPSGYGRRFACDCGGSVPADVVVTTTGVVYLKQVDTDWLDLSPIRFPLG